MSRTRQWYSRVGQFSISGIHISRWLSNAKRMANQLPIQEPKTTPYDVIGTPDPVSNLRPIKFTIPERETNVERLFRIERTRVQNWNNRFWTEHNRSFKKEKEEFRQRTMLNDSGDKSNKSDEISVFYKDFLDRNWKTHYNYNFEWYKKNLYLSSLALRVKFNRILRFCKFL